MKLLLASLFIRENCFLLIDEPTNHMDEETRKRIAVYLNQKKGFILVSHDRWLLDQVVDHIISINKSGIEIQKGNFSSWQENKERQDQMELSQNERLKGEIRRLEEAARRTSAWSDQTEKTKIGGKQSNGLRPDRGYIGHKAAKMMKRSKTMEERQETAVQEKSKLLKNIETADALKVFPLSHHAKRLVEAKDLVAVYDGREICEPLNFEICQGDRIALSGKNGCGKSSILKMILGEEIHRKGNLELASKLKISVYPRRRKICLACCRNMPEHRTWMRRYFDPCFENWIFPEAALTGNWKNSVPVRRRKFFWQPAFVHRHISISGMNR